MKFRSFIRNSRELVVSQPDVLLYNNHQWNIAHREEAWDRAASAFFDAHLDEFLLLAVSVLVEISPEFDLEGDRRHAASLFGKTPKYSNRLREGISQTLCLLGNREAVLAHCSTGKGSRIAAHAVQQILNSDDWRLWASLRNILPNLAEASPPQFLLAVENALSPESDLPFVSLFKEESSGVFGTNYMSGLLWALEGLAWSESYLARVALVLARLAEVDPGGNWGNRPSNSLVSIFLPWFPQTRAPFEVRMAAIRAMRSEYPEVAWKLLIELLPGRHRHSTGSHKPKWFMNVPKDYKPDIDYEIYSSHATAYANVALEMAWGNPEHLTELISEINHLPAETLNSLLDYLNSDRLIDLPDRKRNTLWETLKETGRTHRKYKDAAWALPDEILCKLDLVADKLQPSDAVGRWRYLFGAGRDLYEEKGNWREQEERLLKDRELAVREIVSEIGLKNIESFANEVEDPTTLGIALADAVEIDCDSVWIPRLLLDAEIPKRVMIGRYIWRRFWSGQDTWVIDQPWSEWSLEERAEFLLSLPFETKIWQWVDEWLGEATELYWREARVLPVPEADLEYAADQFESVGRSDAAIDCIFWKLRDENNDVTPGKVADVLNNALNNQGSLSSANQYHIVELIEWLQMHPDADKEVLATIEWAYLTLLDGHGSTTPKTIELKLANDPEFFHQIIGLAYRSDKDEDFVEKSDEKTQVLAQQAWRLLNQWRTPPGTKYDREFDPEVFVEWLEKVVDLCTDSGHLDSALHRIGKVLYYSPQGPEGMWILREIAEVLNREEFEEMRRGYGLEIYNSRGVHTVDPSGASERKLAELWKERAKAIELESFIRFAAVLRERAEGYEADAIRVVEKYGDRMDGDE